MGDRLAEACGALSLAGGAGGASWLVSPLAGLPPAIMAGIGGVAGGLIGWALVRSVPSRSLTTLPQFAVEPVDAVIQEDGTPLLELLLDVPDIGQASRIVQLFEPSPIVPATPGDLRAQIEQHLRDPARPNAFAGVAPAPADSSPAIPDASDALYAALDGIRRTLKAG